MWRRYGDNLPGFVKIPVCLLFEKKVFLVVGDPFVVFAQVGKMVKRSSAAKSCEPVGIIKQLGDAALRLCGTGNRLWLEG